jgi:hypothetical protein
MVTPTSRDRETPSAVTWPELLALASSPEEVVRISLDFFASLTPAEVASLPPECVPPHRFGSPEEIVDYAFTLVRYRVSADEDNTILFRLANFFSHAARRVAELMSAAPSPDAANTPGVGITGVEKGS